MPRVNRTVQSAVDGLAVRTGGEMEKLLLRPHEVAHLLDVGRSKVYELIADGQIPSVRLGGSVRVPFGQLRHWLSRRVASAVAPRSKPRRVSTGPMSKHAASTADQAVAGAVLRLAEGRPFGWRGSATELLAQLDTYRDRDEGHQLQWPADGRALSVALRRLVATLTRDGVQVALGRRGHRGKRLISIGGGAGASKRSGPSGATRRTPMGAAGVNTFGSTHAHADDGDDDSTCVIIIDDGLDA